MPRVVPRQPTPGQPRRDSPFTVEKHPPDRGHRLRLACRGHYRRRKRSSRCEWHLGGQMKVLGLNIASRPAPIVGDHNAAVGKRHNVSPGSHIAKIEVRPKAWAAAHSRCLEHIEQARHRRAINRLNWTFMAVSNWVMTKRSRELRGARKSPPPPRRRQSSLLIAGFSLRNDKSGAFRAAGVRRFEKSPMTVTRQRGAMFGCVPPKHKAASKRVATIALWPDAWPMLR